MSEMPEMLEKMREEIIQILETKKHRINSIKRHLPLMKLAELLMSPMNTLGKFARRQKKPAERLGKSYLRRCVIRAGVISMRLKTLLVLLLMMKSARLVSLKSKYSKQCLKLHNSVGDLGDRTCDTLSVSLENSTAYHTAIERLYKSFARGTPVEQVAALRNSNQGRLSLVLVITNCNERCMKMPNWCENVLTVNGPVEDVQKFEQDGL